MSEKRQTVYTESVSSATVTLNALPADVASKAGVGIRKVVITTFESTAEAGFWGVTASCGEYEIIVRKRQ